MERKKKVEKPEEVVVMTKPGKLHWKKLGGGVLRLQGQIIKPNQEFWAYAEDIPKAFMDCVVCLDDSKLQELKLAERKVAETPEVLYTIKKAVKGLFDVVNDAGKAINEAPLNAEDAKALKLALES